MKINRVNAMALLAIVFAVSSAFVTHIQAEKSARKDTAYYWFNASGTYQDLNTISLELSRTGCQYTAVLCENGYNSSQLNNPAQPSQGVKPGQTPQSILHQN